MSSAFDKSGGLNVVGDKIFTGDVTVEGTLYNGDGVAYVAGGGGGGGGSTPPGGSNTQVQFNLSGAFSGHSGLTYNKNTSTLAATNITGTKATFTNITGNVVSASVFYGDGSHLTGIQSGGPSYFNSNYSNAIFTTGAVAFAGNSGVQDPSQVDANCVFYISASYDLTQQTTTKKIILGGDTILSGTLYGTPMLGFAGINKTIHNFNAEKVIIGNGNAMPITNSDVSTLILGTAGSKDGTSGGVTLIAGDTVISGTLYDGNGQAYTAGGGGGGETPTFNGDKVISGSLVVTGSTTVTNGRIFAAPVTLTEGSVTIDASLGSMFILKPSTSVGQLPAPINGVEGQVIKIFILCVPPGSATLDTISFTSPNPGVSSGYLLENTLNGSFPSSMGGAVITCTALATGNDTFIWFAAAEKYSVGG